MRSVTDSDQAFPPCAGERLRDMIAEHAITLLADWDEERAVTRSARDLPESLSTDAETTGGAHRGE